MTTLGVHIKRSSGLETAWMHGQNALVQQLPSHPPGSSPLSAAPTCVLAGLCRSAVTVAEEAEGTSSVGDFDRAGLAFVPSAGGSAAPGVGGLPAPAAVGWPWFSVKVTDLFWSACAVGTHARARGQNGEGHAPTHQHYQRERRQGWDGGRGTGEGGMQDRHAERPIG